MIFPIWLKTATSGRWTMRNFHIYIDSIHWQVARLFPLSRDMRLSLNVHKLILDLRAVTTTVWKATCHYGSICWNRSKGTVCATNLLHVPQLILDAGAFATTDWIAPGHYGSICQNPCFSIPTSHPYLGSSKQFFFKKTTIYLYIQQEVQPSPAHRNMIVINKYEKLCLIVTIFP